MTPEERARALYPRIMQTGAEGTRIELPPTPREVAEAIRQAEQDARRAALEEAARAVCMLCRHEVPRDGFRHVDNGVVWLCEAQSIRALMGGEG